LSTKGACVDRQEAYIALAKMPGCTALIPPIKGHRGQCALYNMCEEACLFPGAFTQAEISLRTHSYNFNNNEEPQKYDADYSPWGILNHCNSHYMDCPMWLRNTFIPAPCENKGPSESIEDLFKPFTTLSNERWAHKLDLKSTGGAQEGRSPTTRQSSQGCLILSETAPSNKRRPPRGAAGHREMDESQREPTGQAMTGWGEGHCGRPPIKRPLSCLESTPLVTH